MAPAAVQMEHVAAVAVAADVITELKSDREVVRGGGK